MMFNSCLCVLPYSHLIIFFMAWQPVVGQGLVIVKASKSHSVRHTTIDRTPLDE
jgi:hypothetical protein